MGQDSRSALVPLPPAKLVEARGLEQVVIIQRSPDLGSKRNPLRTTPLHRPPGPGGSLPLVDSSRPSLPGGAIVRSRHRLKRQWTEFSQQTRDRTLRGLLRRPGGRDKLHRLRCRHGHTDFRCQAREKLACRRLTQPADTAKPGLLATEFPGQRGPRRIPSIAGRADSIYRLGQNPTHANLHARTNRTKSTASYECVLDKCRTGPR